MRGIEAAFILLFCFSFYANAFAPLKTSILTQPTLRLPARGATFMQSSLVVRDGIYDAKINEQLRTWYLLSYNRRPEVYVAEAKEPTEIVNEAWKSILVGLRVLQKEPQQNQFTALHVFTQFDSTSLEEELSFFEAAATAINENLNASAYIFQPFISHEIKFYIKSIEFEPGVESKFLVMLADSVRTQPDYLDYDDIDNYMPKFDETWTNDIPSFPFPSVFDFVSEINRPPDPATMNELTFNFKVQDLKFDPAKLKKKRDPQEIMDSINCKLTRLQKWRNVLLADDADAPNPFSDTFLWGEQVKLKYRSLVVQARQDAKTALDMQYDKRATFIKIIDQWSDRLKRSLKYSITQKRLPKKDFVAPIINSKWRNQLLNTTKLLSRVPFLDLQGPEFVPGEPEPLFDEKRYTIWYSDYPVPVALYETIAWLRHTDRVKQFALETFESDETAAPSVFSMGHISQHTYSRGLVTERVVYDLWTGFSNWLDKAVSESAIGAPQLPGFDMEELGERLSVRSMSDSLSTEAMDQTEAFCEAVKSMNSFSRASSETRRSSVKEMYQDWFSASKELAEWWTTIVRDLDMVEDMTAVAEDPGRAPWSDIISSCVSDEANRRDGPLQFNAGFDSTVAKEQAQVNAALWDSSYGTILRGAETLEAIMPWFSAKGENYSEVALDMLSFKNDFWNETVTLDFRRSEDSNDPNYVSYLFLAPRYFRGDGFDAELGAFNDFCKLAFQTLETVVDSLVVKKYGSSLPVQMIPLHPQMVTAVPGPAGGDSEGSVSANVPDHARKCPHPAILFRVPVEAIKKLQ